ncbi:MAG: phosphoribosylanthranilate isomerase [bacterium]
MTRIKVCGITSKTDAFMCIDAGVDILGFVFVGESPRKIAPEEAQRIINDIPSFVITVGIFVNRPENEVVKIADLCKLDRLQLHGEESPQYCASFNRKIIKAFRIRSSDDLTVIPGYKVSGYLVDSYEEERAGGTGRTFEWSLAQEATKFGPIILAGGLTPENVNRAISIVRPYAVDVSTGVEEKDTPGKKNKIKLTEFIRQVQNADSDIIIADKAKKLFEWEGEEVKEKKGGFLFWKKK